MTDDDTPAWMLEHDQRRKREAALYRRSEQQARLARIREKEDRAKARYETGEPPHKRQRTGADTKAADEDDESTFLLADYESEDEGKTRNISSDPASELGLSHETRALMVELGMSTSKQATDEEDDSEEETKIFFCSRTHSQLSQFVNELRRVKLPPSLAPDVNDWESRSDGSQDIVEEMKHVTLGSRKNLCINPKVNKLGSTTAINERCLELQQRSSSGESKCQYLPNKDNEALVHDFRDHTLAKIRDIEDFGKLGGSLGICPYYASRASIKPSEIVTLPYPLLLQKSAREALDISLKNHIVVIDEAHNLMDAIANIYSASTTLEQLKRSRGQLGIYLQKFRNKLKGKNRVYVTQLVRLIDSLAGYLDTKLVRGAPAEGQIEAGELLVGKGMDQVNLFKLTRYIQESKIARKVERYVVYSAEQEAFADRKATSMKPAQKPSPTTPDLTQISSFILALTNPSPEGRFFYTRTAEAGSTTSKSDIILRYLLLDPTEHFREVVNEARAVILAGGTMSPMNDYINHLFHYVPLERIQTLSCGHVIPKTNLIAMPVAKGPNGVDFDFTYEKRNDGKVIEELGRAVLHLARTLPDGLVIFFPSYAYLDLVAKAWQTIKDSSMQTAWQKLQNCKRIFMEPKSSTIASSEATNDEHSRSRSDDKSKQPASKVDKVLQEYTAHIHSALRKDNGALLLAVIGGSLSEGINFADKLGRGIIVVGLPFPNARTPEWKARLEFIEQRARGATGRSDDGRVATKTPTGHASREYLENACMRAVNQSIGRAIRHKNDYAAIMLFDRRYERANIQAKLPGWIKDSFATRARWGDVVGSLEAFFECKEQLQ